MNQTFDSKSDFKLNTNMTKLGKFIKILKNKFSKLSRNNIYKRNCKEYDDIYLSNY